MTAAAAPRDGSVPYGGGAFSVLGNRPFLLLWLSQLATQVA